MINVVNLIKSIKDKNQDISSNINIEKLLSMSIYRVCHLLDNQLTPTTVIDNIDNKVEDSWFRWFDFDNKYAQALLEVKKVLVTKRCPLG